MKSSAERKKNRSESRRSETGKGMNGGLKTVPLAQTEEKKKSLFSFLFAPDTKKRSLLFTIGSKSDKSGIEEILELIRFAASLRGDHRKILVAPVQMNPLFSATRLFESVQALPEKSPEKYMSGLIKKEKIDLVFSPGATPARGVPVIKLRSRSRNYHQFPSFWSALPFAKLFDGKAGGRRKNNGKKGGTIEKELGRADLHLSRHNLRFRITMRKVFAQPDFNVNPTAGGNPVWLPLSLDPFTGSPWPFSSYMRLCRILAQKKIPFIVTVDQKTARKSTEKDREVIHGLPVFRKEMALLSRGFESAIMLEEPSIETLFSLAKSATVVVGTPSAELLLAQLGGSRIVFLHDMMTYRSLHTGHVEGSSGHVSHGRSLFEDSLTLGGGLSMKPHVDECIRDCPACMHNYCVDTISPEAVWEELTLLLTEQQ